MQANKLKNNGGVSTAEKNLNEFEKSINSPNQPVQKKTKQPGTAGSTLGESVNASKNGSVKTIKGRSIERSDIPKVQRNIKTSSVKVTPTVELDGGALIESRGFKPIETTTKSLTDIASGRINEKVSAKTYENLTGFNKLTKKASPSGGIERGMEKKGKKRKNSL